MCLAVCRTRSQPQERGWFGSAFQERPVDHLRLPPSFLYFQRETQPNAYLKLSFMIIQAQCELFLNRRQKLQDVAVAKFLQTRESRVHIRIVQQGNMKKIIKKGNYSGLILHAADRNPPHQYAHSAVCMFAILMECGSRFCSSREKNKRLDRKNPSHCQKAVPQTLDFPTNPIKITITHKQKSNVWPA